MENTLHYGDNLNMVPIRQVDKTLKRAEKFKGKEGEQMKIKETG